MLEKSEHWYLSPSSGAILCAGVTAFLYAFVAHKFLMLFVPAGALWLLVVMALRDRWRPADSLIPGQRRMFRGIITALGLTIFVSAWYLIVALDPSLR